MARLLHCGFATRDSTLEAFLSNAIFNFSAPIRTGNTSLKCDSGASNVAAQAGLRPNTLNIPNSNATYVWFVRVYIYLSDSGQYPSSDITICRFTFSVDAGDGVGIKLTNTGAIKAFSQVGNVSSASNTIISIGQWVRVEFKCTITITASTSRVQTIDDVLIDGISQNITATGTQLTATPGTSNLSPDIGWITAPGANKIIYFADCAWNDSSGVSQNSYPGSGKVALLLPISDNARDTLWTGGLGGTTNLFDAVNNAPPTGTASETNLTQIEHAGGAAGTTDRYDANMTMYSSLGILASDTINVMQFVDADGEDASTGTKLLNFEVLSNPVISSPGNVTAGNDAGALGTYPTNWAIHYSNMLYSPSININSSPVMRVRRPETATRVASVCFMGIYVDYTPPTTSPPSSKSDFIPAKSSQIVSVNRASFY